MVRTHTFKGKKYRIEINPDIEGLCDNPHDKTPGIFILERPDTKKFLHILMHESLHALKWSKSEAEVEQAAQDLTNLLWKLGYRHKNKPGKRINKK